jgi:hypothetical protein
VEADGGEAVGENEKTQFPAASVIILVGLNQNDTVNGGCVIGEGHDVYQLDDGRNDAH